MTKLEKIEKEMEKVNLLANEVARTANKELSIAKHKITCLIVLVALIAVLEACVAIFSVVKVTEMFYDMQIEETIETIDQEAQSENGDAININGNSNKVGDN